jgi:Holliday junction resolvase RusA-like endonuclease
VEINVYVSGRRGDLDNYVKSILDGLKGIAWEDDRQVTCVACSVYAVKKNERVEVTVYPDEQTEAENE